MTPATPAAMRAALEARLVNQASHSGDAGRLRRRLVFQRLLRRLADDERWVLKGAYLLESRLPGRARTTRDLDLASAHAVELDALRDALDEALARDADGDFFRFAVTGTSALGADQAGRGGWRFSIDARLAGRTFDRIRVDVVERMEETAGGTELVEVTSPLAGLELAPARVLAVDVAQHAAEKFHAICRTYAGDRPSTRVKDLVDIVLLAESGLLPDPRLGERLRAVFASRDGGEPPAALPEPPSSWARDYGLLIADLHMATGTATEAAQLASELYHRSLV